MTSCIAGTHAESDTDLHTGEGIEGTLQLTSAACRGNECIPDDAVGHDARGLHVIKHCRSPFQKHQLQAAIARPHVLDVSAACMDEGAIHLDREARNHDHARGSCRLNGRNLHHIVTCGRDALLSLTASNNRQPTVE